MSVKFDIDAQAIAAQFGAFKFEAEQELMQAASALAAMTHAHVKEKAAEKLKSSLKLYQDNLGFEEVSPGIWVVSLGEPALSVEDGGPAWDMKPGLLKNAEVGPSGKRFKIIPFDHNTAPTQRNDNANRIVQELKAGLKNINKERQANGQSKISTHKIELNSNGSPRIGLLHKFDIPSEKPTDKAQHPALKGLSIYQSMNSKGKVERSVMTFRTVSDTSAHDAWIYPERKGVNLMGDDLLTWVSDQWETVILPNLFKNLGD